MAEDRMLSDEVLLALIKKNSGGGGGTSNYNDLSNQPQIGGVTLSGNKSASDLGLADDNTVQGILDGQTIDSFGDVETALSGKQASLTAGGYIRINDSNEISVKRLVLDGDVYKYDVYTNIYQTGAIVDKYDATDQLISTRTYSREDLSTAVNIDNVFNFQYSGNTYSMTFLIASTESPAGTIVSWAFNNMEHHINSFELPPEETANDLIIRSELTSGLAGKASTADLAAKQDALTAGSHIDIDSNTVSVQRWAVPAGKVVYTVITSDENYGQNVHIQRHTLGGSFIDDRTFLCEMYKTVNIDGLISIYNPYSSFRITLLENSDEQQAGYNYTVNPITTPTSNSFTFMMEQEENDNDLIIREELDAVSSAVSAIKDGQSIDSFADVETALAGKQATLTFDDTPTDNSNNPVKSNGIYDALALKQNATDNNLTTTDKTTTGAINELRSGLTNLTDDVKLNTQDLTTPSRTKNLLPMTLSGIKSANTTGTWNGNVYTIGDCVFTVNTNAQGQVISIDVSNANTTTYVSALNIPLPKNNNKYKFGGGGGNNYDVLLWDNTTSARAKKWDGSTDSESSTNTTALWEVLNVASDSIELRCRVKANTPAGSSTYYPLLVSEKETDPTFAPYIPSVESRIEGVEKGLVSYDMSNWNDYPDFVGKYAVVGKVLFFSLKVTKADSSWNLAGIANRQVLINGAYVAYDNANSAQIIATNTSGSIVLQIQDTDTFTNPTNVSGCFLLA